MAFWPPQSHKNLPIRNSSKQKVATVVGENFTFGIFHVKKFHVTSYCVHLLPIYPKVKIFHVLNFHPRRLQTKIFNGELFPNYGIKSS